VTASHGSTQASKRTDILVVGTGSLARAFCYALALAPIEGIRVVVLGRERRSAEEVTAVANARAAESSGDFSFRGNSIDWSEPTDLAEKIAGRHPRVVFHTATLQSPWALSEPTSWRDLVYAAGFGVTLPLQAALASRVGGLLRDSGHDTVLVNACYPDAVNALLDRLGLPILCGIGNVGILSAFLLAHRLSGKGSSELRVVAHHVHISGFPLLAGSEPTRPRAWLGEEPIHDLSEAVAAIRAVPGAEINHVVGAHAVSVISALLTGRTRRLHVPGPFGLLGGYPVWVEEGRMRLDLPAGISEDEAIRLNARATIEEGTEPMDEEGFVRFAPRAVEALRPHVGSLAEGFHVSDLEAVADEFLQLRERLSRSL